MNRHQLLVITVPAALEEPLVDWLLADSGHRGFTSIPAYGHHADERAMSIAEQVAGRIRCVQFQIVCAEAEIAPLLAKLRSDFTNADLRYWLVPLLDSASLGKSGAESQSKM